MQEILIDTAAGVTTLTINRVDKKNSFTGAMYSAMADALEQAEKDNAVRVVVIQGHVTVFSAGNDIADFFECTVAGAGHPGVSLFAWHQHIPQAFACGSVRSGGRRWHHHAASLRSGLCR